MPTFFTGKVMPKIALSKEIFPNSAIQELNNAFAKMKTGKAAGPDHILGEYLKSFRNVAESTMLKIINLIFSNHIYPSTWDKNFLKPIYKKLDVKLPENYRGLAIGPAFAKLFSFILLNRLNKYIDSKKLITPNQIGFMKGSRTSDHVFLLKTIIDKVVKNDGKNLYAAFIDFKKAYDTVDRYVLLERLKVLGINGLMLQNIEAMYLKTEYLVKYKNGYLDPISSSVGLKQGCPLSPMLFNLYIDDVVNIFDESCEPITIQGKEISHFLYADDLVLLSSSEKGLQTGLDRLHNFANKKHLTVSIDKSKTMIFNKTGKLIKRMFKIGGENLEPVRTFCYLGYDINASGANNTVIANIYDKASKAMQPLLRTAARFNLPVKTMIRLFDAYISPIMLYNVENWGELSKKKLQNFTTETFWNDIMDNKASVIHRRFLKFVLGVTKSCPNSAVMGDTGELPLILKGYRLMLQYWHRTNNLPNETLVKHALLENIRLKTNWITTIEKLINVFNLSNSIGSAGKLKRDAKNSIHASYVKYWKNNLTGSSKGRLEFYCKLKDTLKFEDYLNTLDFHKRKFVAKLRCSDHELEIEKGRHKNIDRQERVCEMCTMGKIESEEHFLFECPFYGDIRITTNFNCTMSNLFEVNTLGNLGDFIELSLDKRRDKKLLQYLITNVILLSTE